MKALTLFTVCILLVFMPGEGRQKNAVITSTQPLPAKPVPVETGMRTRRAEIMLERMRAYIPSIVLIDETRKMYAFIREKSRIIPSLQQKSLTYNRFWMYQDTAVADVHCDELCARIRITPQRIGFQVSVAVQSAETGAHCAFDINVIDSALVHTQVLGSDGASESRVLKVFAGVHAVDLASSFDAR